MHCTCNYGGCPGSGKGGKAARFGRRKGRLVCAAFRSKASMSERFSLLILNYSVLLLSNKCIPPRLTAYLRILVFPHQDGPGKGPS